MLLRGKKRSAMVNDQEDAELSLEEVFQRGASSHRGNGDGTIAAGWSDGSWGFASVERHLDCNESLDLGRQQYQMKVMLQSLQEEQPEVDCDNNNNNNNNNINNNTIDMNTTPEKNGGEEKHVHLEYVAPSHGNQIMVAGGISLASNSTLSLGSGNSTSTSPVDKRIPKRLRKISHQRKELNEWVIYVEEEVANAIVEVRHLCAKVKSERKRAKKERKKLWRDFRASITAAVTQQEETSDAIVNRIDTTNTEIFEEVKPSHIKNDSEYDCSSSVNTKDEIPTITTVSGTISSTGISKKRNENIKKQAVTPETGNIPSDSFRGGNRPPFNWEKWRRGNKKEGCQKLRQRRQSLQCGESSTRGNLENYQCVAFDWEKYRREQKREKQESLTAQALTVPWTLFSTFDNS